MKLVVDFIKKKFDDIEFKENIRNVGICIVVYFVAIFPLFSILGGKKFDLARQGLPSNWVLLFCIIIEIFFSILMIFSIKIDKKERMAKVFFQYTFVFWVLIPISIIIMEGVHFYADAFVIKDRFQTDYPFKFIFMDSFPFAMDCRQIFHWIASFLPIVLLFAYDLIYLILFRKFENYDKNYAFAKGELLRLSYELEYERRNSVFYQSFLENDDNFKNYLNCLTNCFIDWKFARCFNSRFVVLNPNIELYRINIQKKEEYDYVNNAFFLSYYHQSCDYIEKFFMMVEMIFEKREFEKNSDKNYESIRSSGMPLIVSDRFCNIPKWDDDYFFSKQSNCKLMEATMPRKVKNLGSFRILFYEKADKDEEKFKYVIVTFDDFKKVTFSNIAYILYKNKEDDICVVRFKSGVASDVVSSFYDRDLEEIAEFSYIEHYYAWENIKAKMKKNK